MKISSLKLYCGSRFVYCINVKCKKCVFPQGFRKHIRVRVRLNIISHLPVTVLLWTLHNFVSYFLEFSIYFLSISQKINNNSMPCTFEIEDFICAFMLMYHLGLYYSYQSTTMCQLPLGAPQTPKIYIYIYFSVKLYPLLSSPGMLHVDAFSNFSVQQRVSFWRVR